MNAGELKTRISKRLIDENGTAISSPDVLDGINSAIQFWKRKKFFFNQRYAPVQLTAGSRNFTKPVDFLSPINFATDYYGENLLSNLPIASIQEYNDAYLPNTGDPMGIVFIGGEYKLDTIADRNYQIPLLYIKNYPDLTDDDEDLNDFTVNASELIMYEALERLTAEFQQDTNMEAVYNRKKLQEYENLKQQTRDMASTGRIAVWGCL